MTLPSLLVPKILRVEPKRVKDRSDKHDPNNMLVSTEQLDPSLSTPKALRDEPHLKKDRRDKELPQFQKSSNDIDDPRRAVP
jgi:hypothetical protein